jgi:uncharacterized membrane protein
MSWNPNQQSQGNYPDPQSQSYGGYGGYGQYSQQQQQQQYTYQPPDSVRRAASVFEPTSLRMDPKNAAFLSYLFGFFAGIPFFLLERKNRFVRFHAAQSTLFSGALTILYALVQLIGHIPLLGTIILALPLTCASWVILGVGVVLWIFLMLMAYRGSYVRLPVIGEYAERLAGRSGRRGAQNTP